MTRWVLMNALLAMVLVSMMPPAMSASQPPARDPFLVVPGQSVGRIRLGMSMGEVPALLKVYGGTVVVKEDRVCNKPDGVGLCANRQLLALHIPTDASARADLVHRYAGSADDGRYASPHR
ncbi:MAG: hypothetical protein L0Z46_12905 [Nitrospiraceae bacterium]|nr:hypothetical protein [Nitrospiraceae bacterium]